MDAFENYLFESSFNFLCNASKEVSTCCGHPFTSTALSLDTLVEFPLLSRSWGSYFLVARFRSQSSYSLRILASQLFLRGGPVTFLSGNFGGSSCNSSPVYDNAQPLQDSRLFKRWRSHNIKSISLSPKYGRTSPYITDNEIDKQAPIVYGCLEETVTAELHSNEESAAVFWEPPTVRDNSGLELTTVSN
ncbi:hypothetical protein HOLleu_21509 [Holothuria leucospilota]|uniref:HYR domain-containing protein n=1 Tax=Holothuria leucospilota TaxID=206669 RepID=A0A9Q1H420_HOLLE|nr:hypothetical protein HOLleu_21509 [Holothuria leucospilota]